ncbi:MAG: type IV pilus modification PilV family protein [Burkholderiales bacterium]
MPAKPAAGFTLIEVLVAMTILGVAYAAILGAFSGSIKLLRQASEYQNAMLLARSKLDETAIDPNLDIEDRGTEEKYGNISYAYKIVIRPIPLLEPALLQTVQLPIKLQEITVDVFWGEKGHERRYKLTSYKMSPADGAAPSNAAPATPPAPPGSPSPASPIATPPGAAPGKAP